MCAGVEYTSGLTLDRERRNGTDRCARGRACTREHPAGGSGIGGARYTLESDTHAVRGLSDGSFE